MKYTLLLLLTTLHVLSFAQSKAEKQVQLAVEQLKIAMLNSDIVQLKNIAHNQLSYGHSSGAVDDKIMFVDKIASGKSKFLKIDFTEQTISVSGNTAIVRHNLIAKTHDAGKEPAEIKLKIILVWQKVKGDWKLLARQAVKMP